MFLALAQLSYEIGGAQNNSAPFDLNLDLQEIFHEKQLPKKAQFWFFFPKFAWHPLVPFFVLPMFICLSLTIILVLNKILHLDLDWILLWGLIHSIIWGVIWAPIIHMCMRHYPTNDPFHLPSAHQANFVTVDSSNTIWIYKTPRERETKNSYFAHILYIFYRSNIRVKKRNYILVNHGVIKSCISGQTSGARHSNWKWKTVIINLYFQSVKYTLMTDN